MAELTIQQAFDRALQHHQAGQLPQAEALYRQILAVQPNHAESLHLLGVMAGQVGQFGRAVELIERAIALQPNFAEAYSNLGNALKSLGQLDAAMAACRRAIALAPNSPGAYNNLGNALQASGQLAEAIEACRQAIALRPDYPEAYCNLGNALIDQGHIGAATAAYRQALALNPNVPEAHLNLGGALRAAGQIAAAIESFRQAIALNPGNYEAYSNLGATLKDQGQLDAALEACRQALALNPSYPEACNNLGSVLQVRGQIDEAMAAYQQALALKPNQPDVHSNLVFALHYHGASTAAAIAAEHRRWNQQHAAPLRPYIQPHGNDRDPDRRLRIGYLSPDLREHVVARFLLPLLAHHDKSRVEVYGYAQVPVPDAMTQRLRAHCAGWCSIVGLSDAQVAERIRAERIDILVDLAMHTAHNRLLVFARKPAPVQVSYLAYCSSTGLETMDYRLSDPYLDPPGMDEAVYSEQTVRLPETYWCYEPAVDPAEVGPQEGLPGASKRTTTEAQRHGELHRDSGVILEALETGQPNVAAAATAIGAVAVLPAVAQGFITFGCLNNFCKVGDATLAVWARLLGAVPHSQILLHALEGGHRQRVQARLAQAGVDPQRVRFAGRVPLCDYFRLYNGIDLALDTFPYGGGTTTCDALWMGVPVVSLVGQTAVGRAGLSILVNVGLPDLVARTEEQYVQIATGLANDWPRLGALRATLRSRMEHSPLMDAPRFARNIEAAYRQMWRKWCGGNVERQKAEGCVP